MIELEVLRDMTVGICVRVSDGIVLGCDSASSVVVSSDANSKTIRQIFEHAVKLTQIAREVPVGVLTWGHAAIGQSSVSNAVKEAGRDSIKAPSGDSAEPYLSEEQLNAFISALAAKYDSAYSEYEDTKKPVTGFAIAGYIGSTREHRLYMYSLPQRNLTLTRSADQFGANWFGEPAAITRIQKGFDPKLIQMLRDEGLADDKVKSITARLEAASEVQFAAMPLQDAVEYADYLITATKNYFRFAGAPICGGPTLIAAIYDNKFQWIDGRTPRLELE